MSEENDLQVSEQPADNKRNLILYIISCPSFCLSFCKERKKPDLKI